MVRFNEILGALSSSMIFENNISFFEKLKHRNKLVSFSLDKKKGRRIIELYVEYDISRAFAVFPRDLRTSPYHYKHIKIYTLLRNTVTEYNNFQVIQHHVGFKRVFHYSESLTSSFASTEKPYRIFVREKDRKSETSHKLIRFADFSTPRSSRSYSCPCISRVFPHTV